MNAANTMGSATAVAGESNPFAASQFEQRKVRRANRNKWITFAFCAVFAYVLFDGFGQDLGGKALPMGKPLIK